MIQKNRILIKKETINITELIESIIKRFNTYKYKYQFQFNKIENTYIKADKKRIEQVIYNLIINAINYTGEGKRIYINMKRYNLLLYFSNNKKRKLNTNFLFYLVK